ncbi:MAG: glycerol kinase GlpK [Halanaerobiaceae bacterium]
MKEEYILSVDQSTASTKAIIFNEKAKIIDKKTIPHQQYYPKSGWVEHDPVEIYDNTVKSISSIINDNQSIKSKIKGLALTNQRETVVVWDKETGQPVYKAIVWQCQRGKNICNNLKNKGYESLIKEKTGLVLDPYFSASKVKWLLDNVDGLNKKAIEGKLLLGTIDSWLIWKLTGGKSHVTDFSNASRTLLYNINKLRWDQEILDIFSIPKSMMPEVNFSDKIFGYTDIEGLFPDNIPIAGIMGDSQAALFGQNCYQKGMAKATYGTGSSVVLNTGNEVIQSNQGLVTSLGWGYKNKVQYILEGNIHATGATIKWLVDKAELLDAPEKSAELAFSLEDNEGVYFVPAFVGLGAPYWDNEAKASITGLTFSSGKAHLVRAALEAIAYQIKDVLDLMIDESGIKLKELRADGGPSHNEFLMQFQSDMLGVSIETTAINEISALGSTFMAGLAFGVWSDLEQIKSLRNVSDIYSPEMKIRERDKYYQGWLEAVDKVLE